MMAYALIQIYPGLSDCPHTLLQTPASTVDAQDPPPHGDIESWDSMAVCQRLHSDVPGKLMKLNGLGVLILKSGWYF